MNQPTETTTNGYIPVSSQVRHAVDTKDVELVSAGRELVIQRECPITWVGCRVIICKDTGTVEPSQPAGTPEQTGQQNTV